MPTVTLTATGCAETIEEEIINTRIAIPPYPMQHLSSGHQLRQLGSFVAPTLGESHNARELRSLSASHAARATTSAR